MKPFFEGPEWSQRISGHSTLALPSQKLRFWLMNAYLWPSESDIRFPPPHCRRVSERVEVPEWVRGWVSRHMALVQLLVLDSLLRT